MSLKQLYEIEEWLKKNTRLDVKQISFVDALHVYLLFHEL
jgi:ABC-type transporter Mla MlaB component